MNFIFSPLEQFEVVSLISLNAPILGYLNLSLTNLALYSILIFILVTSIHLVFKGTGSNNTKLIPSPWSIALESSYASINAIVREQIGLRNETYLPFIYSLFVRGVGQFTVILLDRTLPKHVHNTRVRQEGKPQTELSISS